MAHKKPLSRNEAYLQNALGESHELGDPQTRNEELLQELVDAIQESGSDIPAPTQNGKFILTAEKTNQGVTYTWASNVATYSVTEGVITIL